MSDEEKAPLTGEQKPEEKPLSPEFIHWAKIHEIKWLLAGFAALAAIGVTLTLLVLYVPEPVRRCKQEFVTAYIVLAASCRVGRH
jgi:hypothetical protein